MLGRVSNMPQASDRRLLESVWGRNSYELKKKKWFRASSGNQPACICQIRKGKSFKDSNDDVRTINNKPIKHVPV